MSVTRLPVLILLSLSLLAGGIAAQEDDAWDEDGWEDDPWSAPEETGLQWTGFIEGALGTRFDRDNALGRQSTLEEIRLRLETEWSNDKIELSLKGDVLYDQFEENLTGDFRELTAAGKPFSSVDLKIGRQVLTWGIGDLLFLNDLFPKDFVGFFAGRDDEYLKAPSNSLRITQYNQFINIDFAWTPKFTPDEYIRGERFSFFNPFAGTIVAPKPRFGAAKPSRNFDNSEFALRLFRTLKGVEYALYAYRGFYPTPSDFRNPAQPAYAKLMSVGASVRASVWSGLWNAETSYYFSRDDSSGTNPGLPNEQLRFLTGFEREWFKNFTVGVQYYLEWTRDHDKLLRNSPAPRFEPDEDRHLLTARFTYRVKLDTLTWSLFAFVSPSDKDYYLRPVVNYRISDAWNVAGGLNLFGGDERYTFFGQFEDATNGYLRVRYSF